MKTLTELLDGAKSVNICNEGDQHGTLTWNADAGTVTYAPNKILDGPDKFVANIVQSDGVPVKADITIEPANPIFYGPNFFEFNDVAGSSIIDVNAELPAAHLEGDTGEQALTFEFVGSGFAIYGDATKQSGAVLIRVETADGKLVALAWVGLTSFGNSADYICAPIYVNPDQFNAGNGAYRCTITRVATADEAGTTTLYLPTNIRGVRVFGTVDEPQTQFIMARKIIPKTEVTEPANEVLVAAGETANFTINTLGALSLSMRASQSGSPVTLSVSVDGVDVGINSIDTLIDQYYNVIESSETAEDHEIKIFVAEGSAGVLGLVCFKIDGDADTTITGEVISADAESDTVV